MSAIPIEIGSTFGRYTVLERLPDHSGRGAGIYRCRCACGNETKRRVTELRKAPDQLCKRCMKNGGVAMPPRSAMAKEYAAWQSIKLRTKYHDRYSALGMAEEWKGNGGFMRFYQHLGPAPGKGRNWSVDRIDNERGYFPGNVRWATFPTQARNRSNNIRLYIGERGMVACDWAKLSTVDSTSVISRVRKGMSIIDAICTPATVAGRRPPRDNTKAFIIAACCEGAF